MLGCHPEKQKENRQIAEEKNQKAFTSSGSEQEAQYCVDAAMANMYELALLDIALERSNIPKVVQAAKILQRDHELMQNDLSTLAQARHITLPTTLEEVKRKEVNDLKREADEQFEKDFLARLHTAHEETDRQLSLFLTKVKDPGLQSWAERNMDLGRSHSNIISECIANVR
jgi:putative membrane protein